ncbi:hypothetical protein 7712_00001 [Pseudomonas phage bmx-p2]|nr:hypothetical protein 7712_00001 [Pseudomonas phage bmx-p2]WKV29342.1 hypothetical protein vBPaeMP1420_79 [Pseudomonas phage vB_PaeM_P1420]
MVYYGKFVDGGSRILCGEWVDYGKSTILTGFLGSAAPVLLVITETGNLGRALVPRGLEALIRILPGFGCSRKSILQRKSIAQS